jgi:hypothetical protein
MTVRATILTIVADFILCLWLSFSHKVRKGEIAEVLLATANSPIR